MVKAPTSSTALATAKIDSAAFQRSFRADPVGALAAKGLSLSPAESRRLTAKVRELAARPGGGGSEAAKTEVEVSVKIKF